MRFYFVDGDYLFAYEESGVMKNSVFTGDLVRRDLVGSLAENNYGEPYVQFSYDEEGHQIRDDGSVYDDITASLGDSSGRLESLYW